MKLSEVREITYKEFIKLPKETQKQMAQVMNKNVKARMKALENIGADSYAVNIYNRAGGVKSVRGQKTLGLWRSVSRGQKFMEMQTSSVKGYKKLLSDTAERMLVPEYETMSNEERNDFWDLYNQIEETGFFEELRARDLSSDYVQTLIFELYDNYDYRYEDADTVIDILRADFDLYENERYKPLGDF